MNHIRSLDATLIYKAAMVMAPYAEAEEPAESKYLKRRRVLARVLPALLLGLYGGVVGRGVGKTRDAYDSATGSDSSNHALNDMLIGGLGGAALGYGAGAVRSGAREWAGADPMLNTVAMGKV